MHISIYSSLKQFIILVIYNSLMGLFILGYLLNKLFNKNKPASFEILSQRLTINLNNKREISNKKVIWLHGASIGEIKNALKVIEDIYDKLANHHIIITSTSFSVAKLIKNLDFDSKQRNISFQLLPFDIKFLIRRFIKSWQPSLVIWNEQDIWPNTFLVLAENKNLRKILIQGRISNTSFKLWTILGKDLFIRLFSSFECIYLQNMESLARFKKLGITRAKYRGNLKYYIIQGKEDEKISKNKLILKLRKEITNVKSFQYISSHAQDEEVIMFLMGKYKHKILSNELKILIAPRHPKSIFSLKKRMRQANISCLEISELLNIKQAKLVKASVIIWDILGSIDSFLSFESKICIIGGSFGTKLGGHNPYEPLYYNKIVIFGKDMKNFPEAVDLIDNKRVHQITNYKHLPNVIDLAFDTEIKAIGDKFNSTHLIDEISELILS